MGYPILSIRHHNFHLIILINSNHMSIHMILHQNVPNCYYTQFTVNAPKNGYANIFSILVATNAL